MESYSLHGQECLLSVYRNLAGVVRFVFEKVGIPHVVMWDALLFLTLQIGVRADSGNGVV